MITMLDGDALAVLPSLPADSFDAIVTDPPYGETSLQWDRWPVGWVQLALRALKPTGSLWCFGSMRMFLETWEEFDGLRFVQDVIWEKQNGSGFISDRFRRVHEHALHFVKTGAKWADVYKSPVFTMDATARQVRRKTRPAHMGQIGQSAYTSEDGGPRLMRSVIFAKNCHGRAVHPTQKPEAIVEPILRYSVPPGGSVLDPFAGSGTTLLVARSLGLSATGIEADAEYASAARARLGATLPLVTR